MDKFSRKYRILIDKNDGTGQLEIMLPFSIEFTIKKSTLGSANQCNIRIFNLAQKSRENIEKDYALNDTITQSKSIKFFAGYEGNMPLLLSGFVTRCWSARQGVNFVTNIDCWDAGINYQGAIFDDKPSYPAGSLRKNILLDMMLELEKKTNVSFGAIGNIQGSITRAYSVVGSIIYSLREFSGDNFFIENNKSYVIQDIEALDSPYKEINRDSGILSTPEKAESYIRLNMIFEPQLRCAQQLVLNASGVNRYNGLCKVMSFSHSGVISDNVSGKVVTSVELLRLNNERLTLLRDGQR